MRRQVVIVFVSLGALLAGCVVPERSSLRIAISPSPGSAVFYCAQEAGLFQRYDVNVHLIELVSGDECRRAFVDGHVDAAVVPYVDEVSLESESSSAGICMLLAAPRNPTSRHHSASEAACWSQTNLIVLVGDRSGLMQRRQEWQRILLAYEHARMLILGEKELQSAVISEFERRSGHSIDEDLQDWNMFGLLHQDSLLEQGGPYSSLNARWQGRHFLTSATDLKVLRQAGDRSSPSGDKAK